MHCMATICEVCEVKMDVDGNWRRISALFCRQIDRLSAAVGGTSSFDNKTTPYVGHFSSDRMRLKFPLTETTKQSIPKLTSPEDVLVLFIRCMESSEPASMTLVERLDL